MSIFSSTFSPLAEGDILQWNSTGQKFKPAQLPVDSVNGETGVVSLGIQDMDDYELNVNQFGSVLLTTLITTPDRCVADGQFGAPKNNNDFIGDFFLYYGGGDDYVQFSKLTLGDSITFTFDDGSQHIICRTENRSQSVSRAYGARPRGACGFISRHPGLSVCWR